ncbi:MAG: four helix bundle protein [Deltaproteobacteria bacterium]|nr:MAG: four helix bundle protein [Deltaproteobacteria bacterium]
MAFICFENLRVFQLAEKLCDDIWEIVGKWNYFEKDTVGKQLVRSADSIGANIAEGSGRGYPNDNKRFVRIARGSLNETKFWLRRASKRGLMDKTQSECLTKTLDELAPTLNAFLSSIGPNT